MLGMVERHLTGARKVGARWLEWLDGFFGPGGALMSDEIARNLPRKAKDVPGAGVHVRRGARDGGEEW